MPAHMRMCESIAQHHVFLSLLVKFEHSSILAGITRTNYGSLTGPGRLRSSASKLSAQSGISRLATSFSILVSFPGKTFDVELDV